MIIMKRLKGSSSYITENKPVLVLFRILKWTKRRSKISWIFSFLSKGCRLWRTTTSRKGICSISLVAECRPSRLNTKPHKTNLQKTDYLGMIEIRFSISKMKRTLWILIVKLPEVPSRHCLPWGTPRSSLNRVQPNFRSWAMTIPLPYTLMRTPIASQQWKTISSWVNIILPNSPTMVSKVRHKSFPRPCRSTCLLIFSKRHKNLVKTVRTKLVITFCRLKCTSPTLRRKLLAYRHS